MHIFLCPVVEVHNVVSKAWLIKQELNYSCHQCPVTEETHHITAYYFSKCVIDKKGGQSLSKTFISPHIWFRWEESKMRYRRILFRQISHRKKGPISEQNLHITTHLILIGRISDKRHTWLAKEQPSKSSHIICDYDHTNPLNSIISEYPNIRNEHFGHILLFFPQNGIW